MRALILALLKNDDDGEMQEMTDCIQKKEQSGNFERRDVKGDLGQVNLGGTFEELIITGHSRCLHSESLKPLEMQHRKVGGYPVDDVSKLILKNILSCKFKTVSLWCCEAALSSLTRDRQDGGAQSLIYNFCARTYRRIKKRQDAQVSIVEKLACDMWESLSKANYFGEVVVQGLNGVGDVKEDGSMKTFDQTHLKLYNELSALKKLKPSNPKKVSDWLEKITSKEAQIDQVVQAKQASHIFGYKLQVQGTS